MKQIKLTGFISTENIWNEVKRKHEKQQRASYESRIAFLADKFGQSLLETRNSCPFEVNEVVYINHLSFFELLFAEMGLTDTKHVETKTHSVKIVAGQAKAEIESFCLREGLSFDCSSFTGDYLVINIKGHGYYLFPQNKPRFVFKFESETSLEELVSDGMSLWGDETDCFFVEYPQVCEVVLIYCP